MQVSFAGWTADNQTFRSAGEPLTVRVADSIGWHEALLAMVVGETRRIWMQPEPRNDGAHAAGDVVDVALLALYPMPKAPALPAGAGEPPPGARTAAPGLSYKILSTRDPHAARPKEGDVIAFNQTMWTPQGDLVDSSYPDGAPRTSPVSVLWDPWKQLLSFMRVGDKVRFWLSEAPSSDPASADEQEHAIVGEFELLYVYADPQGAREAM